MQHLVDGVAVTIVTDIEMLQVLESDFLGPSFISSIYHKQATYTHI